VRSGDFILALLNDAKDVYEYGFALGAMAHYAAITTGTASGRIARFFALSKIEKEVWRQRDLRTGQARAREDGIWFRCATGGKRAIRAESYHDYIGFEVAQGLLERAFCETYGVELNSVLVNEEKTLTSYRHAVGKLLPKATRIAWHLKKDEITDDLPGMTKRKFLYNLRSRISKRSGARIQEAERWREIPAFIYLLIPKWAR